MGVYIKGMEMPKEKKITLTLFPDGRVYANHGERLWGNGKDCIPWKAVPVPPHGRLIDADDFIKDECNHCDGACEAIPCNCLKCRAECRCEFIKDLAEAQTVIPAEEAQP